MLWRLFACFFKIGLFTFGGGYAMISLIENECVDKRAWITHDDMVNVTVIAESTPGPIAVNAAAFVGYKQKGFWGALVATLGVVLPSFVIIFAVSSFLERFLEIRWVASAFRGVRAAVGLLVLDAAVRMIAKMKKDAFAVVILILSCAGVLAVDVLSLRVSTVFFVIAAAVVGLIVFGVQRAVKGGGKG